MPDTVHKVPPQLSHAFGDALREILQERAHLRIPATGKRRWTSTTLANELQVDATLVRRWLRGESIPPLKRPYVQRLTEALQLSDVERHRLETALVSARKSVSPTSTIGRRAEETEALARLTTSLSALTQPLEHTRRSAWLSSQTPEPLPSHGVVITDSSQVVWTGIQLFRAAAQGAQEGRLTPATIFLTYHGADSLVESEKMTQWWAEALHGAMDRGWGLWHHLRLDKKTPSRSVEIVESMLAYLGRKGEHIPYYQYGMLDVPYDLVLVPGIGGLICFATRGAPHVDAAIFVSDTEQLAMLESHARLLCMRSDRLMRSFWRSDKVHERMFNRLLTNLEQQPGGRDLQKLYGLSALTRPLSFYAESSPFVASWPQGERVRQLAEINARWQAFERHARTYPYRDICSKQTVQRYVHDGRYLRDGDLDNDLMGETTNGVHATWGQIRDHLVHTVQLLTVPELRYEIALVDDDELRTLGGPSQWEVVGDCGVALEVFQRKADNSVEEFDIEITEPTLVRAFHDYFEVLWSQIRPINRDKEEVVRWLQQRITDLERDHPEAMEE